MVDKIKNQGLEKGRSDSLSGDNFSRKEIADVNKRADPRDAASFADSFAKKKHDQGKNESGKLLQKSDFPSDSSEEKIPRQSGFVANEKRTSAEEKKLDADGVLNSENIKDASALNGMQILNNLQMQRIESASASAEAANVIKNLGVEVAEKIIASYEALNAKQEVRITLQENILKDTEISISKDGKSLNVNFVTQSDESASILNHRSGELRTQLMEKLHGIDHISIGVERQESNENQSGDGRSGKQKRDQEEEQKNSNQ
ncbi:MAG: flagellar hook-length control protein FliK [Puniceicoccales bacterium]|jgi:Cu/Ag efflux protein CusF|nr:flagellar hook-length control protein FliK [Puniceicoccales bacterium]